MQINGDTSTGALPGFSAKLDRSADGSSFEAYRKISAAMTQITLSEGTSAADFWFESNVYHLPNAVLFRVSAAGYEIQGVPRADGEIMMFAHLSGTSKMRLGARDAIFAPREVGFVDFARPFHTSVTEYELLSVNFARDRVPPVFLELAAHGAKLEADGAGGRFLYHVLQALLDAAPGLTIAEADAAVDAMMVMAGAALETTLAHGQTADAMLTDKALAYIARNLGNPDFGPEQLQTHLGLSRSRLYRLFASRGGVGAVLMRQRLDRCMKALFTVGPSKLPLRDIVDAYGFRSEAHFNRAFRAHHGITPGAFRDMVKRKDQTELGAFARQSGFNTLNEWIDHVSRDIDKPS